MALTLAQEIGTDFERVGQIVCGAARDGAGGGYHYSATG